MTVESIFSSTLSKKANNCISNFNTQFHLFRQTILPHLITHASQSEGNIAFLNLNFLEANKKEEMFVPFIQKIAITIGYRGCFIFLCLGLSFLSLWFPQHRVLFFPQMKSYQVKVIIIHLKCVLKPTKGQNAEINSQLLFYLCSVRLISLLFPVPNPPLYSSMWPSAWVYSSRQLILTQAVSHEPACE